MAEAGQLTEKALAANGSYVGAFEIPADADSASAALANLQSDPAFVDSLFDKQHPLHKANVARRDQLMARAHGVPEQASEAQPSTGKPEPQDYRIEPEQGQTWQDFDSELAADVKGWAATMELPQAVLDQAVFAYNTAAKGEPPSAEDIAAMSAECEREMTRRFGDRLPALLEGFQKTLAKLPDAERDRVEDLIDSSGMGSSIPFVGAALEYVASQAEGQQ
jgi:hypothetical protein